MLLLSALVAVSVNLSTYVFLGLFSALALNIVGHVKTIVITLGGWALFGERLMHVQILGGLLAGAGAAAYSWVSQRQPAAPAAAKTSPKPGSNLSPEPRILIRTGRAGHEA